MVVSEKGEQKPNNEPHYLFHMGNPVVVFPERALWSPKGKIRPPVCMSLFGFQLGVGQLKWVARVKGGKDQNLRFVRWCNFAQDMGIHVQAFG